jgi:hypothetical protein
MRFRVGRSADVFVKRVGDWKISAESVKPVTKAWPASIDCHAESAVIAAAAEIGEINEICEPVLSNLATKASPVYAPP